MDGEQALATVTSHRPHWGYQTSLFQWRQPAFWFFLVLLAACSILMILEQAAFLSFSPGGFALSWFLMILYAVPVFLLIYLLDLYEREPISLLIAALLWGGLGATALSLVGNTGWGLVVQQLFGPEFASRWVAALTAPWVEEVTKGLGVVFIYLIARREIDGLMDGFVYGAMVGLGFTIVEDVFYFVGVFGGDVSGVLTGFYLRVVASGLYGHVLYSGLVGMGIAYFVTRKGRVPEARRWGIPAALFLVAVLAHLIWNSPLLDLFPEDPWEGTDWLIIPLATAVKGVPLLVFVVMMVRLAHRREHMWLERALATEIEHEGLTRGELDTLMDPRARRQARRELRARGGPAAERALKRLHREQINLAMVRTRVHEDDHPDLVRQRDHCARLREAVQRMVAPPSSDGSLPPS